MWFRKKQEASSYDPQTQQPVIRTSICTGEQVAGFRNRETGKFSEVMLIRTDRDLEGFCKSYGVSQEEISREY